uniref:Reverse transcriptase domain-containing protein n=1 Tax=Amphimedon queenslandica TaxID=400682 RepID=A0A1X7VUV7_AMPQE
MVVAYLDDGIGMGQEENIATTREQVRDTLQRAGFVAHQQKSQWNHTDCLQWLGFFLNTTTGKVQVPQEKIAKARCLASLTGKIISMWLGLGNVVRMMTRAFYRLLHLQTSWYNSLELDSDCRKEIDFWLSKIDSYNGQSIWHSTSA